MDDLKAELFLEASRKSLNGVAILSREGKVEWVNQKFCEISGLDSKKLLGNCIDTIASDLKQIRFPIEQEEKLTLFVNKELCKKAILSLKPIGEKDGGGYHLAELTSCEDTTDKVLEQEVKEHRRIISSLNEGYILVDEHANIHDVNAAYCELVGYSRDELLSMKLTDLREGMTKEYRENFVKQVHQEGGVKFRTRHRKKDGNLVDLEANAAAFERNGTTFLAGFVWDITDRLESQKRLKESEQRWHQLVNNNPLPVIISTGGIINFVNRAALELYGTDDKDKVLGKSVLDFVPDEDKESITKRIEKVNRGEKISSFEQTLMMLSGEEKQVEVHTVPIVYKGENAAQTVFKDITELKQRQRQIRINQQRFMSLFRNNPHPVYYFDMEGNFMGANKKVEEISGYPESELLNMNFAPIIVEDDLERTISHFEAAAGGEVQEYEIKIKTKEGDIRDLRVNNFPMKVFDEIVGVFGIAEDITSSKKAKEDLIKSEQKWQHLVEDNPQAVQVTIHGEIVFINEAGARLYGAEKPIEVIGRSVFEFSHPDYVDEIEERLEKIEQDKEIEKAHDHKIISLDGEIRDVEISSIPIEYQGKEAIQTVLFDVTDRKKKESIIEASLIEKEVLLKEIHHRVKNNMAVVSGLLELQSMNTDDEELNKLLKESQLRIHSMAMIHEKLYQTETFSVVDFGDYIRELVQTITDTIDTTDKEITVDFHLGSVRLNINQAIPAALILNEVVVNSFKHAFKGRQTGSIAITVSEEGNAVVLEVTDDGIGLPKDFEPEDIQSLGTTLIHTLSSQLRGELIFENRPDCSGTYVRLSFEKDI
ncbi:PAS domain S-box protein [Balneolaceae bacterium YR4-1]|uniref:PAS domain S-box protein n=1 Tax=Halalkalibaculum roseum TaxID=2709311 RepID=A0A6M1TC95_9BACT|nr:PAS domain S-box protein [Halalkalibaculum roseum]NGP77733.1 PAS domain S-box protein [Halalkalibaculum roseum]